MTEAADVQAHITAITLALYDVNDALPDLRVVHERTGRCLTDLEDDLVTDLLIVGSAQRVGICPDVPGLIAVWGADALLCAAPRLVEVLTAISRLD